MMDKIIHWGVVIFAPLTIKDVTPKVWALGASDAEMYFVALVFTGVIAASWIYCIVDIIEGGGNDH